MIAKIHKDLFTFQKSTAKDYKGKWGMTIRTSEPLHAYTIYKDGAVYAHVARTVEHPKMEARYLCDLLNDHIHV